MKQFQHAQKELLRDVIRKWQPSLAPLLDDIGRQTLNIEQREALRGAVAAEFCSTGLSENDEPNARGLLLEDLIDLLGHV